MQKIYECKSRRRNERKLSMTAKFDAQGCGFFSITWKVTRTPEGQHVLMSAVKVLECREREWYAIHNVWGFLLRYFRKPRYIQNLYRSRGTFSRRCNWCKSCCNCTQNSEEVDCMWIESRYSSCPHLIDVVRE